MGHGGGGGCGVAGMQWLRREGGKEDRLRQAFGMAWLVNSDSGAW